MDVLVVDRKIPGLTGDHRRGCHPEFGGARQVAFQIEWYFLVRLMPEPVNIAQMPALEETPPVDEFRPTGVVGDYSMISAVMAAEVADEIG